jgi:Rrf2 family transcriptional regulator, cysteine metabolism repressor
MKLSTRTRYGIRAVLELAEQYGKEPVQLKNIASQQEISVKYLEQLMTMLKSAGIVSSLRGSKGGYILSRPPNSITLSDCFNCLEGPIITVECVQNDSFCHRSSACAAREVWKEVDSAVMDILQSTTLEDVISKARKSRLTHYQI